MRQQHQEDLQFRVREAMKQEKLQLYYMDMKFCKKVLHFIQAVI